MTKLPDYGHAIWRGQEHTEFIFQDFPVRYVLKVAPFFSTSTETRIESVDYEVQVAFDPRILHDVRLLAPAESAEMIRVWTAMEDPAPLIFPEAFLVAVCGVLPTVPEGYDVEIMGKLPFVIRAVFPPGRAPLFGTGEARTTKLICFAEEAKMVPRRWLENNVEAGAVVDPPRLWKGGLIRVVSSGPGQVKPEIWDGATWISGGTLLDAHRGVPADLSVLTQFGVLPEAAVFSSAVHDLDQHAVDEEDSPEYQAGSYSLSDIDRNLLSTAAVLLRKVAAANALRPSQLVTVAKLLHVVSRLPQFTPELDLRVSVIGPRRKSGDAETWHYWDFGIERKRLFVESGGHFYQPSSGGDSFTTMNWSAVPGELAEFEDYRDTLWMVPDIETFEDAVAGAEFTSGAYRIEVTDFDNPLLGEGNYGV